MLHLSMSPSVFSGGRACVHACVTQLKGSSVLRLASMTRVQQYHQVGLTVVGHTHHGWQMDAPNIISILLILFPCLVTWRWFRSS